MQIIEITSLNHPGTEPYHSLTEAQLRSRQEGHGGIFIAESPKIIKVALDAGYKPVSLLCERKHITGDAADIISRIGNVPIYTGERGILSALTGYTLTRGVLCAMHRPVPSRMESICKNANRIAVIDNVVEATNVGAIFRSAAALGIEAPFLGSDTLDDNMVLAAAEGTDVQLYVSTFYQEGGSPEFDEGVKSYINSNADALTNNGGNDTIAAVTAMGYDAYYVALEALKAAGSTDPAAIKAALAGVTYDGVSGHIAFDEQGDAIRDTAYIKHSTNDGAWELETQQTVAQ